MKMKIKKRIKIKEKLKLFFASIICLWTLNLWAEELLIVSDIDDTLKISHVLDKWDMINNAPRTDSFFLGTNLMLNLLINENPDSQLYYISNAPDRMMRVFHERFIEQNAFPRAPVLLRNFFSTEDFKVTTITRLVREHKPKIVVAIGDNGEEDAQVYDRIKKLFPEVQMVTSIHMVYSSPQKIEKDQKPWVTALDLGLTWQKRNLIKTESLNKIAKLLLQQMSEQDMNETRGQIAFPQWMDCSDMVKRKPPTIIDSLQNPWFKSYVELINKRCS